jgi:hypothetical protein
MWQHYRVVDCNLNNYRKLKLLNSTIEASTSNLRIAKSLTLMHGKGKHTVIPTYWDTALHNLWEHRFGFTCKHRFGFTCKSHFIAICFCFVLHTVVLLPVFIEQQNLHDSHCKVMAIYHTTFTQIQDDPTMHMTAFTIFNFQENTWTLCRIIRQPPHFSDNKLGKNSWLIFRSTE